jgi:hypothetical protein
MLTQYRTLDSRPEITSRPIIQTPIQLVVRCLAERKENYWQAFSLEFGLAVQGDSLAEVKRKLESMIVSYVYDALVGEDREFALQLLNRKATFGIYLKYWYATALSAAGRILGTSKDRILFIEPLPLKPVCTA